MFKLIKFRKIYDYKCNYVSFKMNVVFTLIIGWEWVLEWSINEIGCWNIFMNFIHTNSSNKYMNCKKKFLHCNEQKFLNTCVRKFEIRMLISQIRLHVLTTWWWMREPVQCGDFLQVIGSWWWPREGETHSNDCHFKWYFIEFKYDWHFN
jgi:hypothetical protein